RRAGARMCLERLTIGPSLDEVASEHLQIRLGKGFSGEQLASAALKNLAVSLENRHGPVEDPVDNPLHRSIDLLCCCLAVSALDIGVADLAQEAGSTVVIADEAELLVHAVSHHHGASDIRGFSKV